MIDHKMNKFKPKSAVWEFFTQVDGKNVCNYCYKSISAGAFRMKEHILNRCPDATDIVKSIVSRESKRQKVEDERPSSRMSSSSNSSITSFVDTMTNSEKEDIDSLISKLIFKANLSFRIVENEDFKNLLQKLKPSYRMLNRRQLSEHYLDIEFKKVKHATDKAIKESIGLSLQMDGWSNINRSSIINIMVCIPQPIFLRSYNTGSEPHTSKFLLEVIDEQIECLGVSKLVAVITDNAANMSLMRRHINEKYPTIQEFGCAAHALNLIIHDITEIERMKKFVSSIETIVKEVTQSNIRNSIFSKTSNGSCKKLIIRNKTRWYTTVNMLQSVFCAKEVLGKMAFDNNLGKSRDIILERNDQFWAPLDHLIKLLKPINAAIGIIETDKTVISEVPNILNNLSAEIITVTESYFISDKEQIFDILEKRREFMETPFHYFANIVDPRFLGRSLSNYQKEKGHEFFDNHLQALALGDSEAEVLKSFQNFRSKSGCYKHQYLYKESYISNPFLWWKSFLDFEEEKQLANICTRIFTVPASSAATERSFSNEGRIHTKLRNRLSDTNVEKLLSIQFNSSNEWLSSIDSDSEDNIDNTDCEIVD